MALDDLIRYETAAIAARNVKEKPEVALTSISKFYETYVIPNTEDPISRKAIQRAFEDATYGILQGLGISNAGVLEAIGVYAGKYDDVFKNALISDILEYVGQGYEIPQNVTQALSQYRDMRFSDLEDETAKKAIEVLKTRRLKNYGLSMEIDANNEMTSRALLELYPSEESGE